MEIQELHLQLRRIEGKLDSLITQRITKDYYSTAEVAEIVGRSEFTVRHWCRTRRILGQKRPCGRGSSQEWMIPHVELERVRNEGLLPIKDRANDLML